MICILKYAQLFKCIIIVMMLKSVDTYMVKSVIVSQLGLHNWRMH